MKDKLLYLALGDITKKNIAPSIRMAAFKKGFDEILNENYYCISGLPKERAKQIKQLLSSKELNSFTCLYIESSNRGLSFWDVILICLFRIKNPKISVFIRDGYPLFKDYWTIKYYRQTISNILWLISFFAYKKFANILYFPSTGLANKFNFKNKKILKPATYVREMNLQIKKDKILFYAGGIGQQYDMNTFLMACDKLSFEQDFKVIMYCRENEIYRISKWLKKTWLKIEHKNLEDLDFQPNISVIPLKKHSYSNLAFPVKLLDYIGIGSVILATDSSTTKEFIQRKGIGLIANAGNVESYYNKIKELLNNEDLYKELLENVQLLKNSEEITWENRCQKILDDFGFEK